MAAADARIVISKLTMSIFIGLMLLCICIALWLVRVNRWPRVQVRVLKKWEEVTGRDNDNNATGWQHADIEYWYQSQKYSLRWRGDLQEQILMAPAVWMVVNPNQPEEAQLPADWGMAAVFCFMAFLALCGSLLVAFN
jgi:hypothetical protein